LSRERPRAPAPGKRPQLNHLDLARSSVPSGAAMMLVPHYQLVY